MDHTDKIIDALGIDHIRELHAIAWFCDSGDEGKDAVIGSDRLRWYYGPDGEYRRLISHGLVKLHRRVWIELHKRRMPALSVTPLGRAVLCRAKVRRLEMQLPSHRHVKRGSDHWVRRCGVEVQTSRPIVEGDRLTIYADDSGKWWARLDSEFNDGRFIDLEIERTA